MIWKEISNGLGTNRIFYYTAFFSWVMILFVTGKLAAQGVTIEGSVVVESSQKPGVSTNFGSYGAASGSSFGDKESSSQELVMWLEAKEKKNVTNGKRSDTEIPLLDQVNKRFNPRLILIRVGDLVRIHNSDPVYHNVFSLSKTKRFDVGRRSPREFQDVKFDKAGKVDVFCDIHSDMHAVIIVASKQTVAMKKMKGSGQFRFGGIPKGKYTLHLYALGNRRADIDINTSDEEKITLNTIRLGS